MNLKPVLKICLGCEHKTTFRFRALNVSFQNKSMLLMRSLGYLSRWIPSVKRFTSNYSLTISCSRNWISLEQATFFRLLSNFREPVNGVNCSFSFLFLADSSATRCGLLLFQPVCFKVLCIRTCSSLYLECNKWLFVAFLLKQSGHFLMSTKHYHPLCFLFFRPYFSKLQTQLCGKVAAVQQFLKYSDQPNTTNNRPASNHLNQLSSRSSCSI